VATLLIDNYDSYTFNLYQLIAKLEGAEPVVVRNDELGWDELRRHPWSRIVVSPGPGRPHHERDLGISRHALEQGDIPVLGVCLGHEALAYVCGGAIVPAPEIVHGRISEVRHCGTGLFDGIPQDFRAVRYHSLIVGGELPDELEAIAWSEGNIVMAIRHRHRPAWGVQFHPESVGTEHGERLLANFHSITSSPTSRAAPTLASTALPRRRPGSEGPAHRTVQFVHRVIDGVPDEEAAFSALFSRHASSYWLDSSMVRPGLSRFSFMGVAAGRVGRTVSYRVGHGVEVECAGERTLLHETIFDYLARELRALETQTPGLPFDFNGGFVGYLGYELKADCGAQPGHPAELPDACLLLTDRMVAFDHQEGRTHVIALADGSAADIATAEGWMSATAQALAALPEALDEPRARAVEGEVAAPTLSRSHDEYIRDIEDVKRKLEAGESYEVCLTNRVKSSTTVADPFELYRVLRRTNPAPYSAFLRFPDGAVLSSSPERFLRIERDRWVETKPIKGTAARRENEHEDAAARERLRSSEKDRAENLMIVDLLRNDLGVVSEVGTVHVAKLMDIETYETVHQMVSTVRGRLREDVDAVDCIRATFPGGSMTGAPKLRTMEIIDALETESRGVYSGALGYLALNGSADLSIVIRTLVATERGCTIGCGGAIVMLSNAEEEYEEMLLKARPLANALAAMGGGRRVSTQASADVPHVAADRGVELVAERGPGAACGVVVAADKRGDAGRSEGAKALLARRDQAGGDASAAVRGPDGEAVHVPPPAIPGGDQRGDDLAVALGEEQGAGVVIEQLAQDVLVVGGHGVAAAGLLPEREHAGQVLATRGADHERPRQAS
jgi:para-aminobenzoate synthetase